jgi:beta-1,4-mannosyl-glycoprotein beta-1,4-N-acetylglucosaminyltransferase
MASGNIGAFRFALGDTRVMIIDCFPFYNELELLEIRLEELKEVVDWFVLVEAAETYSGKSKPFVFEANRERFQQYNIAHIKIDKFPTTLLTSWQREEYTRNAIIQGLDALKLAPADIIMLSDMDEIPRAGVVASCARAMNAQNVGCFVFHQTLSYYYVNCQTEQTWLGTRMMCVRDVTSMQALRSQDGVHIPEGGWHFSYVGGAERIQDKIGATSHTELDRPEFRELAHVEQCMAQGSDLFGREMRFQVVPLDAGFPAYLLAHQERFQNLIARIPAPPPASILFEQALARPSDIQGHLNYLYRLASTVEHITEFGTRSGQSTAAFLYARPKRLICYDLERSDMIAMLEGVASEGAVEFTFHQADVLEIEIEPTDLLFIDTWHVEQQIAEELRRHADKARRYLVLHDTETFGLRGETAGHAGIWPTIAAFVRQNPQWRLLHHFAPSNGLTVLTRIDRD